LLPKTPKPLILMKTIFKFNKIQQNQSNCKNPNQSSNRKSI